MGIVKFTECWADGCLEITASVRLVSIKAVKYSKGRCIDRRHDVKFVPDSAILANKSATLRLSPPGGRTLTGHFLPLSVSFSVQQQQWRDVPFAVTKFRVA